MCWNNTTAALREIQAPPFLSIIYLFFGSLILPLILHQQVSAEPAPQSLHEQISRAYTQSHYDQVLQLLQSYPSEQTPTTTSLKYGVLSAIHLGKPEEALSGYRLLIT